MDEISSSLHSSKIENGSNFDSNKKKITHNESEIIVKYILEKILSLTITSSNKNKIEKIIPDYCTKKISRMLELITDLDFITYDKDDIDISMKIKEICKIKSGVNLNSKIKIEKAIINENVLLDKTVKNIEYQLRKNLDPNKEINVFSFDSNVLSNEEKKIINNNVNNENLMLNILERKIIDQKLNNTNKSKEKQNKNKDPFELKSSENIEKIQKLEEHKIEFQEDNFFKEQNLPFQTKVIGQNFWGIISEPLPPKIERSATTKIKYEEIPLIIKSSKHSVKKKNRISEELENLLIENPFSKNEKNEHKKNKHINIKKEENNNNKQQNYPLTELSSYDIDPNKIEKKIESQELILLRNEIIKKNEEKIIKLQKILEKEKELKNIELANKELEKELRNKNVTVDINGNLVFVKHLKEDQLINEFRKGKSKSKQIKLIESPFIPIKRSSTIEKNPNENGNSNGVNKNNIKNQNKLKKKVKFNNKPKNQKLTKKLINTSENIINQKSLTEKNEKMKYINGSNFNVMKPECGVNIIEKNKFKSGGKNFLKKYNKYSVEIFQELSKTFSSSFYKNNEITNSLALNTNIYINDNSNSKTKELKETKSENKNKTKSNVENSRITVKTYNLSLALQNLDLITESEERLFLNKKIRNKNILKMKNKKYSSNKLKNDLGEMNIFAKTIMDGEWTSRVNTNFQKYEELKCKKPLKPENIELGRELPLNILKHLPRKRLPPINSLLKKDILTETFSDTFRKKIYEKENKNDIKNKKYQSTSNYFYQNSIS